jgi:hypothetical protein
MADAEAIIESSSPAWNKNIYTSPKFADDNKLQGS